MHTTIVTFNHGMDDLNVPMMRQPMRGAGISVGENVWIGARCVILDGVILDGVILDGVILDGVILDGVILDGVILDGVILDGVILGEGAVVAAAMVSRAVGREDVVAGVPVRVIKNRRREAARRAAAAALPHENACGHKNGVCQ